MTLATIQSCRSSDIPAAVQQVIQGAEMAQLPLKLVEVESDYYDWELAARADRLQASSVDQLCKTLLFENTRWKPLQGQDEGDHLNSQHPKYVLVCIQYTDKLSTKLLNSKMREIQQHAHGAKFFNMRVAPEEAGGRHSSNGVTPVGRLNQDLMVVVTERISKLDVFYLGAGHVDWKLSCDVQQFIQKLGCRVWDLSE
ncbi:hypothetical protein HDU91_000912 [Kappamyces sp. JEL0680]|nr:hypothetical protein HDU91_000912 [Kappamyces sp. JEL0680]